MIGCTVQKFICNKANLDAPKYINPHGIVVRIFENWKKKSKSESYKIHLWKPSENNADKFR
jgi:hypothetical protein